MDKRHLRILIVHNNTSAKVITRDLLSKVQHWTCEPEWTTAYEAALTAMVANQHDIYLVDYQLINHSGLTLLQAAVAQGCQKPVILLVEQESCQIISQAITSGAADVLFKDNLTAVYLEHVMGLAFERVEIKKSLHESNEVYHQLATFSPDGLAIHSNGTLIYLNPAGAVMLGANDPDSLIGQSVIDFVHADYHELAESRIQKLFQKEVQQVEPTEEQFIRLDGQIIDVEVTAIPITFQGEPAIQVFFKDITHRKRAQAERERLLAAEREQRELAEALRDVAIALNSTLNLDELFSRILANVGRVVPHDTADIMLIEDGTIRVVRDQGYEERGQPSVVGMSFLLADFPVLQKMATTKKPLALPYTYKYADWVVVAETSWIQSYAGAPIWTGEQVFGILNLNSSTPGFYNPTHAKHLQAFAHHASLAIANARLLESERKQREVAEALQEAGLALSATLDSNVVLDRLLDQIGRVVPYDAANIMLVNNDQTHTSHIRGYEQFGPEIAQNIAEVTLNIKNTANLRQMLKTRQPMVVFDTAADPAWKKVAVSAYVRSWIGAPIIAQDRVVAFFSLDKIEPGFYQPEHAALLSVFASQASLSLENARLFDAEAHRRREAETLQQATAALTSALDLTEVLDNILTQIQQVVPYDSACIFLHREGKLHAVAGRGFIAPAEVIGQDFPAEDEFFQTLAHHQQPICLTDAQTDPRFKGWGNTEHIRGWLAIPLIVRQACIGYLTLDSQKEAAYGPAEMLLGQTFANQAAIAITNAQLFQQTQTALVNTEGLYQVSRALIGLESMPKLLQIIANKVAEVLPATWVTLVTLDLEVKSVNSIVSSGPATNITRTGTFDELMSGLTGWAVRQMKPALSTKAMIPDLRESLDVQQNRAENQFGAVLVAPLQYREKIVGTMTAVNRLDERDFTERDVKLMVAMANQAAVALENARLFQAAQESRQLSDSLREIGRSLVATLDLDEVLNRILDGLGKVVPFDSASVMFMENNALRIKAGRGLPDNDVIWSQIFPIDKDSIKHEIHQSKTPVIIADTHQDPRFIQIEGTEYIRSWLGVPLLVYDKLIGILTLDHHQPGFYTHQHAIIAGAFAQQAAIALENARLFDETDRRARQLAVLNELASDLTGRLEVEEICNSVAQRVYSVFNYYNVAVFTVEPETNQLVVQINVGAFTEVAKSGEYRQAFGHGLIGQAAATGEIQLANNAPEHPDFFELEGMNVRSELAIPLKVGKQLIGVLNVDSDRLNAFDSSDIAALTTVADQLAVALDKARLFAETRHRAEQLEVLHQATQDLTILRELDTLLRQIITRAIQLLNGDGGGIYLYRSEQDALEGIVTLVDKLTPTATDIKPGEGIIGQVWQTGSPVIINDYKNWSNRLPDWVTDLPSAAIGVPIKWGNQFFGVLGVSIKNPQRHFTPEDATFLSQFAAQAAVAIENSRLYEKIHQHAAELEVRVKERTFRLQALYELAYALGHATQLGDVLRLTLLQLYQTVPHAVSASLLLTDTANMLIIQSQHHLSPQVEARIQSNLLDTLRQLNGVVIEKDNLDIHRIQPKTEIELQPGLDELGSVMTFPVLIDDAATGILLVATEKDDRFDEEQVRLLHIVANQAAETIKRLQSLLAAEHQRLENLVAHLPNGLIMLDSEHRIVLANQAAKQLLSPLTSVEVGSKLTHLGSHTIEVILENTLSETPFVIEPKETLNQAFEITTQPVITGTEAGGSTLIIRDITEDRNIQRRVQQQERMAAVGQLAAGIAHDFNNILTSIIGYAELLLLNPGLSPSTTEDLGRITKQGHRAAHLVRQILDFSRQTITKKHPLDMASFIKETIKLLERTIPEDIHISLDAGRDEYIIKADITQMQQAITNLAVNARDAMPNGGSLQFKLSRLNLSRYEEPPHPDITSGEWVVLAITDTGVGIPPELRSQIFEPFFTTKEVGKGTGLGLAQVYGIVKQHEGHISVTSQGNSGATFTLYLPALPLSQKFPGREAASAIPRGNNEALLLVEDDASVLTIATNMLQHLGYTVLTATNGFEALDVYKTHHNDIALVLTDLTMPKMGGAELTLALREQNPNIRVIALTGYPLEANAREVLTEGMVDWLQKPLNLKTLAHTISQSLKLKSKNVER